MADIRRETAPISVSQASALAKNTLKGLGTLCVIGEVSGFRGTARGGHCYFEVKDAESALSAIIWKGVYQSLGFTLEDGQQLVMYGDFDVYKASGKLSFVIRYAELAGEGILRQQVAQLERRLAAEGLMDDARKLHVPEFCERIVVCTSFSGKVLHDVEVTLARRNPLVVVDRVECSVQGKEAPPTIIDALRTAEAMRPDAILLVRGGGSFEELMCFNDEGVARAIAACTVPIVTGIGHEPDTTIADKVADKRASTPTAAAEQVAPSIKEIRGKLDDRRMRLASAMGAQLSARAAALEALASRPCLTSPYALLEERAAELVQTEQRLADAPLRLIERLSFGTDKLAIRLGHAGAQMTAPFSARLARLEVNLHALSPLAVLGRGYAIVHAGGHVITSYTQAHAGDALTVQLADGAIEATVTETQEGRLDDER